MATRRSIDLRLDEFCEICETAESEVLLAAVTEALSDRHYRLVAKAAAICGEQLLYTQEAHLIAAYPRMLDNPVKKDPHCIAKGAIVRALVSLDCQDYDFFLAGMRYHQLEPTWGGSIDTALDLRNSSAMGLVGTPYHRAAVAIAELLNDSEAYVRAGAIRAMACVPPDRAEPLLRFKALSGDPEPDVVGECFAALLQIDPDETVNFVRGFLEDKNPEIATHTALALGESRYEPALGALCDALEQPYVEPAFRRILVRAVVLQRNKKAHDWLLSVVQERDIAACEMVIEELGIYRANSRLKANLEAILNERGDPALLNLFHKVWKETITDK